MDSNALGSDPNSTISDALSFISTSSEEIEEEIATSHWHRSRIIILCAVIAVVAAVIEIVPTLFPPTPPSARKRRFSELEDDDDSSSQSVISSSSSAGSSPTSHSDISSTTSDVERERRITAFAMSSMRYSLLKLINILREILESRKEQMRSKKQRLERQYLDAIHRMQELDPDLSPEDQVALVDLFEKDHDSAMTYLLLKSDSLRKAWIKHNLTKASSG